MNLRHLISEKIFKESISQIEIENGYVINTINAHSYCVTKKDKLFENALSNSDILLPDGYGIILAAKVLLGINIKRIAGADLHLHILKQANVKGNKVFYLGSSNHTLKMIKKNVSIQFPNIEVSFYSPPFKSEFCLEESLNMVNIINSSNADILFVGMTAPKQEKWVNEYKNRLNPSNIASIGAAFDFYAGNSKRAPKLMIRYGFEWLHRSLSSRRIAKRNLKSIPIFLKDLVIEKLR